jgi:hypothetical protein
MTAGRITGAIEGAFIMAKSVTVTSYRDHPLYPRICQAVATLLKKDKVVRPVDVLVEMQLLKREHLEDWRFGRAPYLERVVNCNLSRLSTLLRILRFHAHDLNLKPSFTAYHRWGRGAKQKLRFSKTGDPNLEKAYATHLVWPGKEAFPIDRLSPPIVASSRPTDLSRIAVIHQSSPSTEEVGLDEGSAGRTRQ